MSLTASTSIFWHETKNVVVIHTKTRLATTPPCLDLEKYQYLPDENLKLAVADTLHNKKVALLSEIT